MQAVILAGGFGTRLKSVLPNLPKPMAPIHGQPFLEYVLENLKRNGISEFIFCLYYMAEKVKEYFGDGSKFGVEIKYSIEPEPRGTGGAIGLLRNTLKEPFCVLNADTYQQFSIQDLLQVHRKHGAVVTFALAKMEDASRYGKVQLENNGRIVGFVEKGINGPGFINAGFYLMEPEIFRFIAKDGSVSLENEVFPLLLQEGKVLAGCQKVNHFFDIGIPEDYQHFQHWVETQGVVGK